MSFNNLCNKLCLFPLRYLKRQEKRKTNHWTLLVIYSIAKNNIFNKQVKIKDPGYVIDQ